MTLTQTSWFTLPASLAVETGEFLPTVDRLVVGDVVTAVGLESLAEPMMVTQIVRSVGEAAILLDGWKWTQAVLGALVDLVPPF
jgi:hypothetical protein